MSLLDYLDDLYAYALFLTRNPNEAEDLVQDTYVRAIKSFASLNSRLKLKSWLIVILRNVWISQLRKKRTAPIMVEIDQAELPESNEGPSKNPYEYLLSKKEGEQVRAALQRLSLPLREIIVLREYQGLSYEEIAGTLVCPVGTVMSRLARARSKLRTLLLPNLNR
jgi:RNA polymerase sigma-70 factor (ECF subfamily)